MKKTGIIVATGNKGKYSEIKKIFVPFLGDRFVFQSLKDLKDPPKVKENGRTYYDNALKKAKAVGDRYGEITLSDDSGLEVDLLNGAPGIRSARYSGPGANDSKNIAKILKELEKCGKRRKHARFVCCALAYFPVSGKVISTQESVSGHIIDAPKGSQGFGYDPIFYYPPFQKTFAQVPAKKKNSVSHRYLAFRKLGEILKRHLL